MPNPAARLPENIAGAYYVDDTCIDCDQCRSTAPNFFKRHDDLGLSFVYKQPATPDEIAQAEEARLGCPSESIGREEI